MKKKVSSKDKLDDASLPVVHRKAAGIDIGSRFHVVAVPPDLASESIRTFDSFTGDLQEMARWLKDLGIKTVAMESTGVYWIPAFSILQEKGIEVYLVNASLAKNVPGRKTDINDAQWLQRLHSFGLLRNSFQPAENIASLRAHLRHRDNLIEYKAAHIQHIQKALMLMNLQVHHVVSDITGVTGMRIVRAIVAGERDARILASFRDVRCKSSLETIEKSLVGNYKLEHLLQLRHAVELCDHYQQKIDECDQQIESILQLLQLNKSAPEEPLPKHRHRTKQPNDPNFDARSNLYRITGVDVTKVHGMGPHTVLKLIGECGLDMSKWPTAKHFTSWLTLSPGNKISGGKVLSSKTRRSTSKSATMFRLAAVNVGKMDSALGAFYRRLAARVGKAKAVTATARKLAVIFYNTLRYGTKFVDPGAEYYEEKYRERVITHMAKKAKKLGFELRELAPA